MNSSNGHNSVGRIDGGDTNGQSMKRMQENELTSNQDDSEAADAPSNPPAVGQHAGSEASSSCWEHDRQPPMTGPRKVEYCPSKRHLGPTVHERELQRIYAIAARDFRRNTTCSSLPSSEPKGRLCVLVFPPSVQLAVCHLSTASSRAPLAQSKRRTGRTQLKPQWCNKTNTSSSSPTSCRRRLPSPKQKEGVRKRTGRSR